MLRSKQIVIIISSPRSGSTLLGKLLDSHESINYVNECLGKKHYQQKIGPGDATEITIDNIIDYFGKYKIQLSGKIIKYSLFVIVKILNKISKVVSSESRNWFTEMWFINSLHEPLFAPLFKTTFRKLKPDVWVFKEVDIVQITEYLKRINPQSIKIIYLIRSPYSRTSSVLKFTDKKGIFQNIDHFSKLDLAPDANYAKRELAYQISHSWRMNNDLVSRYILPSMECKVVRYEDLILSPDRIIPEVFTFMDIKDTYQSETFRSNLFSHKGEQIHNRSVFKTKKTQQWDGGLSSHQLREATEAVKGSHALSEFYPELKKLISYHG